MSKKSRRKNIKSESGGTSKGAAAHNWAGLLTFAAIMVLFLASGFSSLIYQVVWTRMLVLVFGATTFATSTVLAIFMGGLALGSFIAGRYCDKVKRPLLWYGALEAVIGIWAILTPGMFAMATPVYKAVWQATHASLVELSLLRFACTACILIVPTTCMGATLPLLARFIANGVESIGSRVGTLYSINTLGAVAGAVGTGFFILPTFGLNATLGIGSAVNMLLLGAVLVMSRLITPKSQSVSAIASPADEPTSEHQPLSRNVKLAALVFAASGAIAMIYEVCWTRTLLMVVGSSTYAFTIMLAAFLIGIFIGSFVCSRFIDRAKEPLLWFALLQLIIGALTLVSMRLFNQIPYLNLLVSNLIVRDPETTMLVRFFLAGSVLAPITVCLGAIFPAVVKACTTDVSRVGRSVGFLYSSNTLGAIIGAFLAGFVCLPLLGAERTLILGAIVNTALGLLLLWGTGRFSLQLQVTCTLLTIAVMSVLMLSSEVWDRNVMLNAQGSRRWLGLGHYQLKSFDEWRKTLHDQCDVKFWADGTCSNVGVMYHKISKVSSLITNGHIDASDDRDAPVQALLSAIPLLLKPDAKDIAIVGWGCGQTVGIATLFPVSSIDAVELEPKVIEASRFFKHMNLKPESDNRVHLNYNDGRNFLLATDKKYDMIVSEPSNPWQSGVCNLFTKEFFGICKNRLKADGVLSVWMQTAEVPPDSLCGVIAALNSEFEYTVAFTPKQGNLVLLASAKPLVFDFAKMQEAIDSNPVRKKELHRVGIDAPSDVLGRLTVSSQGLRNLMANFLNTDDHNRLEFDVGRSYEDKLFMEENSMMLIALSRDPWKHLDLGIMSKEQQALAMMAIAQAARNNSASDSALKWAFKSQEIYPNVGAYRLLGEICSEMKNVPVAEVLFKKGLVLEPKNAKMLLLHGNSLVTLNRREEGRKELEQSFLINPLDRMTAFALANSYAPELLGSPATTDPIDAAARQHAERVLELLGDLPDNDAMCLQHPNVCLLSAQAYIKLGQLDKAEKYVNRFLGYVPKGGRDIGNTLLKMISSYRANGN